MNFNIKRLDRRLIYLYGRFRYIDQQIALLAMLAIARHVRTALPEASTVGFAWSDEGFHVIPDGFYTAEGEHIGYGADDEWLGGYPWTGTWEDELGKTIWFYCVDLTEINEEVWKPFTTDTTSDGMLFDEGRTRLKIDEVLASGEPTIRLTDLIAMTWKRWRTFATQHVKRRASDRSMA
ncbi:hypothetical protein OG339_47895 (plasmid) [Streptosporangium sp. NBC_01495]|uniref:hypothetical protein n=1 Tax=Streptosporangium sp. NBC_01495 TaxID=2903899 RepID=UPI002E3327C2|nr:hypothetical protein [Streptosporangium sp. NBC_01495]